MKITTRLLLSLAVAVLVFWLYQGGVWFSALMTVRTPFYYSVHAVLAWIVSGVAGIGFFLNSK